MNYKIQPNTYLKLKIAFIIGILLFAFNCQEDDNTENIESSSEIQEIISRTFNLNDIPHFDNVVPALNNLESILNDNQDVIQQQQEDSNSNTNSDDNFSVLTDNVLYMIYADTHTYTFKLNRNNPKYYIENAVLHYNVDSNSYDEYLVQYNVSKEEYLEIINGDNVNEDTDVVITKLEQGSIAVASGVGFCFRSCQTITARCTAGGNHSPSDPECCANKGTCSPDQGGFTYQSCGIVCIDPYSPEDPIDDSGESSGGGGGATNGDIITNPNPIPCEDNNMETDINGNCYDSVDLDFEITETIEFQKQKCLKSIKDAVVMTGEMQKIIKKFKPTNAVLHLEWGMFSSSNWQNTGNTGLNINQDTAFININTESLSHVSNIVIVKTIAHEIIHAELYRKLKELVDDYNIISLSEYNALQNNFMGIADYTFRYGELTVEMNPFGQVTVWGLNPDFSLAHHNQMATFYRQTLIEVMKAYDTLKGITRENSETFYEALSWAGLRQTSNENGSSQYTDAWKNFKNQVDINESDVPVGQRTYDRYETIINRQYNNTGINCN